MTGRERTSAAIRHEVPDRIPVDAIAIEALGAGGGYICGPDHHIKPDVPPANARALFEAATRFRRPGYTQEP